MVTDSGMRISNDVFNDVDGSIFIECTKKIELDSIYDNSKHTNMTRFG